MTEQLEPQPFDVWGIVEIMGHRQIAGRLTEQPLAGTNMLRVDVPAVDGWPEHTKYFGGSSIYAIHPCTEELARTAALRFAEQWGFTPLPVNIPQLAAAAEAIRQTRALVAGVDTGIKGPVDGDSEWDPFPDEADI